MYIVDSKNIQAKEVMKQLEVEEEAALECEPNKQVPNSGCLTPKITYFRSVRKRFWIKVSKKTFYSTLKIEAVLEREPNK